MVLKGVKNVWRCLPVVVGVSFVEGFIGGSKIKIRIKIKVEVGLVPQIGFRLGSYVIPRSRSRLSVEGGIKRGIVIGIKLVVTWEECRKKGIERIDRGFTVWVMVSSVWSRVRGVGLGVIVSTGVRIGGGLNGGMAILPGKGGLGSVSVSLSGSISEPTSESVSVLVSECGW
jgi:hypothetical protein